MIEHSSTKVAIEADGTATRDISLAARMIADSGVKQFAVLKVSFTDANESVEVESVEVRKADGTVIKTPESDIQDMPQEVTRTAPMYSDIREKHIAVKGLDVGDLLEYRFRIRTFKPQVSGQFWFAYNFFKDVMIKDERLEISCPSKTYLNVRSPDFKFETSNEGGRRIYRWSSSNLKRTEAPDVIGTKKPVVPIPSVQVSTFRTWEEVGHWYGGLQQEQVQVTPLIQAKADSLTKGINGDEEKIRAIYNYVSLRVHYIGVSFGIGRYQPHGSEDVLNNGYGDCKDKHTLLASLLKAAGYDSWPVLINISRKIDPELPSPGQFDHVITAIPTGGHMLWADSTPEVAPFGFLLFVLRDKEALAIPTSGTPKLLRTPSESPVPASQLFTVAGKLDGNGTITAHMEETARGDEEVLLRAIFRQIPQSQWKQFVQTFSYRLGFGGDVSDIQISDLENLAQPFHLSYEYTRKKISSWEARKITVPLPIFGIEGKYDELWKAPQQPEELGPPKEIVYRSSLQLPPGYTMTVPAAFNLVKPYAEYHATHSLEKNVLSSTRRMVIRQHEVLPRDWENFRSFCKEVTADEETLLTLRRSQDTDRQAATYAPSETRRAISGEDARRAEMFNQSGTKKYGQGNYAGALLDYSNAIALYPEVANYYYNAGLAEGRLGHHAQAIALYQKSVELNPHNMEAREDLGWEYWTTKQWKKAADVYREMLRIDPTYKSIVIRQALVSALDANGDHEEARKLEAELKR